MFDICRRTGQAPSDFFERARGRRCAPAVHAETQRAPAASGARGLVEGAGRRGCLPASASAAAAGALARLVDVDGGAVEHRAVHGADGGVARIAVAQRHEAKATAATGVAIRSRREDFATGPGRERRSRRGAGEALPKRPPPPPLPARYRVAWASLLEKVFGVDVLACPVCPGRMKVIALLEKPCAVRAILRHLGLRDTPLPVARSRGPPQPAFNSAAWQHAPCFAAGSAVARPPAARGHPRRDADSWHAPRVLRAPALSPCDTWRGPRRAANSSYAPRRRGFRGHPGAITFVQRFSSALRFERA
jgi:hypothetical protein